MSHYDSIVPSNTTNGKEFILNSSLTMVTGIVFKFTRPNTIVNSKLVIRSINKETCQETCREYYRYELELGYLLPLCTRIDISCDEMAIMLPQYLQTIITYKHPSFRANNSRSLKNIVLCANVSDEVSNVRLLTHNIDGNTIPIKKRLYIVKKNNLHTTFNKSIIKGFIIHIKPSTSLKIIGDNMVAVNYDKIHCDIYLTYLPKLDAYYVPINTLAAIFDDNVEGCVPMYECINVTIDNKCVTDNVYYVLYL